mgnify:CR=1 FL=1
MNRSLKEGEVDELKTRADIYSIVSSYVSLKRTGKNFVGLCPFHKEKTPSFTVDPIKQFYHCFGCGEGGDVISFIMKIENMQFLEAVEFLANKVGYNLSYVYNSSTESREKKNKLLELSELAKKYYNYILFKSKKSVPALDYLKKRKFEKPIIEQFEVGFSLDSWDNFSNFAKKRGYGCEEILECGLAIKSRTGRNGIYDRFRGRIMFPIKDVVGKTVGFGGRIIPDANKDKEQTAKYINTPETKLYSKSKNVYGIFEAKSYIIDEDRVFIVEGYTDVMALNQYGIKNVVASLGTALTSGQIKLLGRFTKNIVLVFDSDEAGRSASLKGMERLKEYNERLDLYHENNMNISVSILEEGYDPADFIMKRGKKSFIERIENSVSIIDFTIDVILRKYNISNLYEKLKASDELLRFISALSSRIVQEECIKKIALKLNLRESLLLEEMLKKSYAYKNRMANWSRSYRVDSGKTQQENIPPPKRIEIEALTLIVNGIGNSAGDLLNLGSEYFRFDDTRKLYLIAKNKIDKEMAEGKKIDFPLEISPEEIEDEDTKKLYNYVFFNKKYYKNGDKVYLEVLNNLKRIYISGVIEDIRKQMLELENNQKRMSLVRNKNGESELKKEELENRIDKLNRKINELEKEKRMLSISG